MKKIFLSGDPTHPLYHRYQNVAAALEGVFEAYEIACVSEHFETFETQDYEKYDLAVLYTDKLVIYNPELQEYATLTGTNMAKEALVREDGSALLISSENARLFLP